MIIRLACTFAALSLLTACSTTPQRTAKNICMANAANGINKAKAAYTASEETQPQRCRSYAAANSIMDIGDAAVDAHNRASSSNALINNTIIIGGQQNQKRRKSQQEYYNECMSNPAERVTYAPPAHLGYEKALYAIKSTALQSCPAEFVQAFNVFVTDYEMHYKYIQRLGSVSLSEINEITTRALPTNETERTLLKNLNTQFESHKKVVAMFGNLRD